jgi:hypothetical protein
MDSDNDAVENLAVPSSGRASGDRVIVPPGIRRVSLLDPLLTASVRYADYSMCLMWNRRASAA